MKYILLIFLFLSLKAQAATFYFAAGGNDANTGTSAGSPWKTLAKFNSIFPARVAGDIILFNRGDVFYGNMYLNKAGGVGNPIVIGAYGTGANPIITGFQTITGWQLVGSNIWESSVAVTTLTTVNMVVINGVNIPMGRYPNTGYLTYTAPTLTTKTVSGLPSSTTNWTGATAVMRLHHWVTDMNTVTAHSGTVLTHTNTPNPTSYTGISGYGLFIQNDPRTLDQPNEWYFNPTTKKLRIFAACAPSDAQVTTIDTLVRIPSNRGNITIQDMKFTGSNKDHFTIMSSANITIQNCQFDFAGMDGIWGGANGGSSSANFKFLNNTFNHTNNNAILLREEFTSSLIQNNTFDNTAMQPGMGRGGDGQMMAIRVQATGALIEKNTIDSTGYIPIFFAGLTNTIRYNFITYFNMTKMDGGGIYTYNFTNTGTSVTKNTILYSRPSVAGTTQTYGLSHAIYLDNNSAGVQVDSNSAAGFGYSCMYLNSGAKNNNIFGNTFYDADNTIVLQANGSGGLLTTNNTFTNNIYVAKAITQRIHRTNTTGTAVAYYPTMGTFTNNWYTRPIDDATSPSVAPNAPFLVTSVNSSVFNYYSLATWKTATSNDVGSSKALAFVAAITDIRFEYNETAVAKVVLLGADTYKDVKNVTYTTSVTIPAYSSKVLLKQ